ncbi:hypothetical protein [Brasilonema octagenarum]
MLIIEDYTNVIHLVSNIKGSLKSDCSVLELIRAMFLCWHVHRLS